MSEMIWRLADDRTHYFLFLGLLRSGLSGGGGGGSRLNSIAAIL
jgi:hypothetical protein